MVTRRELTGVAGSALLGTIAGCQDTDPSNPMDPSGGSTQGGTPANGAPATDGSFSYTTAETDITTRDHGVANPGIKLWKCDVHSGTAFVPTRGGNPVRVGAYDLEAGEIVDNFDLSSGIRCLAVEATEDYVYFGTSTDGGIHRLQRGSGNVEKIAEIGSSNPWGISVAPDGTLYAGGKQANVYEVDPDTGEVEGLGRMAETEKYAYDVFATEESVYVGVGNTDNSGLYEIDRASGTVERRLVEGISDFIRKIDHNERYLLCHGNSDRTFVVDRRSKSADSFDRYHAVEPLPGEAAIADGTSSMVYYPAWQEEMAENWRSDHLATEYDTPGLYSYDVETREHARVGELPEAVATYGLNYRSGTISDGVYAAVQNDAGNLLTADVQTGDGQVVDLEAAGMTPTPATNQAIGEFRGQPVTSRNAGFFLYDVEEGTVQEVEISGEAKQLVTVDDTLYIGVYTGAEFWKYDGSEAVKLGQAAGQTRPQAMVHNEATDTIVMGTQPGYSKETGGAISILDRATEEVTTHKNVIENQSISALASDGSTVYAGSNTRRGSGTDPVAEEAVLAAFDVETGTKEWETSLELGHRRIVELANHGGTLYGITNSSWKKQQYFVFDPGSRTKEAVTTVETGYVNFELHDDRFYGVVGSTAPPNDVYAGGSGGVVAVDPSSNTATQHTGAEKIFSFLGDSEIIGDTMYYVDAESWHLKSIPMDDLR
jgi:hypothetical protein